MTGSGLGSGGSGGWRWPFVCSSCRRPYPEEGLPHRCPRCGGVYDLRDPVRYAPSGDETAAPRGLSRYRSAFPLPPEADLVTLGEGGTPLLAVDTVGRTVHFKCEHLNPTGSFKDRGAMVLVSAMRAVSVESVVEDSSGNAGAALAAYCARAGIRARVYMPSHASGPKRLQIAAYGAEVVPVPGPRSAASEAVQEALEQGAVYASHALLPHMLAGIATMAFEIVEQLGRQPGTVIAPAGQGSVLLGLHLGFDGLRRAGVITGAPVLVGVQARACAPLWAVYTGGAAALRLMQEGETVAEGIRTLRPVRGDAVMAAAESSGGGFVAVEEEQILAGRDELARRGLYVEPTSAVVWPALQDWSDRLEDPVVAILTGSGLKSAGSPPA
jgi:threonine synthase